MSDYDLKVRIGDVIRNKTTLEDYVVKEVQYSPGVLAIGHMEEDLHGIQDVVLEDNRGKKRTAAAVRGKVMSHYWEKVQ